MERNKDFVYLDSFVWDTDKNEINKKKHGISFELAVRVFNDPLMIRQYDNKNSTETEERWKCTGFIYGTFQTLTVAMTEKNELKRIISARKATKEEAQNYEQNAKTYL